MNEFDIESEWSKRSNDLKLIESPSLGYWIDICGFGSLLKNSNWDLENLQKKGAFILMNQFYSIAGQVTLPDIPPRPNEKILVINDGIAKVIDLKHIEVLNGFTFLVHLRETLSIHYRLLKLTKMFSVGIRTVFAAGHKMQYTNTSKTGDSFLLYDLNQISDQGKKFLDTQYLYNPAEFQMNTAFAKAYSIESLGTKNSVVINGLFIEKSYLCQIAKITDVTVKHSQSDIKIYFKEKEVFRLKVGDTLELVINGLNVEVYRIDKFIIHKEFDNDPVEFKMYEKNKSS